MIKRDFPFYHFDKAFARKSYEHWYNFFDDYTLRIVKTLIVYRTKKNNLEKIYQDVFNLLVIYNTEAMNIEGIQERRNAYNNLNYEIFTKIFKTLDVPFKFDEKFYNTYPIEFIANTDKNKWQFLKQVFYDMNMAIHPHTN